MVFDNPFKQLDKKNFRDSKNPEQKNTKIQKASKALPKQKTISSSEADDNWLSPDLESENELFLRSMTQNTKIFNKESAQKKEAPSQASILQDKVFSNSYANASELEKKEEKREEKKSKENNSSFGNSLTIPNSLQKKFELSSKAEENKKQVENLNSTKALENTFKEVETEQGMDFFTAMQDVKPLSGKEKVAPPEPEKIVHQNDRSHMLYDFEEGKLEFALTYTEELIQCNIMGLDILTLAKLQQRHYNPEAHLDLHGLNAYQAFHALIGFFKNAYYRDMRCVLIVTGKGLNSFDRVAILRSKVANWLIDSPFKHLVLAYCSAQAQDGGNGAIYVLLRKRKKNARDINWEQMPNDYDLWADLDK